jgi:hypothetical protein
MEKTVTLYQIEDLAKGTAGNEIILETGLNIELHIVSDMSGTTIMLPYENRVDIINGEIIIRPK